MLISINLTKKTYHMLEYERYPVVRPGTEGNFDDLIEAELATVHPDHREEFREKFSYFSLVHAFSRGERIVSMEVPHQESAGRSRKRWRRRGAQSSFWRMHCEKRRKPARQKVIFCPE